MCGPEVLNDPTDMLSSLDPLPLRSLELQAQVTVSFLTWFGVLLAAVNLTYGGEESPVLKLTVCSARLPRESELGARILTLVMSVVGVTGAPCV